MLTRFCPACGTEVDESALFCPTCGQPIDDHATDPSSAPTAEWRQPEATNAEDLTERPPPPAPAPGPASPSQPDASPPPALPTVELPITWPVMASGWLIGVGAVVAALGVVIGFFDRSVNLIDVLLLLAFLAVAGATFFSASIPAIAHRSLAITVVALIGFGVGLDRIGFGRAGIPELLLFLGAAAASIGAILAELGMDQPLGGPRDRA